MSEPSVEKERKLSCDRAQLVKFLQGFKEEVEAGEMTIEGERVILPEGAMEVEMGFKIEDGKSEIEIEIKWKD